MQKKSMVFAGLVAMLVLAVAEPVGAQGWSVQLWGGGPRVGRQGVYSRQAYENGYRRGVIRGEQEARSGRWMGYRDDREYRSGDFGFAIRFGSRNDYRQAFRAGFEAGYRDAVRRNGRYGVGVPRGGYRDVPTYPNDGRYRGDQGAWDSGRYPNDNRYPDAGENGRYGTPGSGNPGAPGYGNYPAPGYGNDGSGQVNDVPFRNGYADGLEKGEKDLRDRKAYDPLRHDWYRDGDRHYDSDYGPRDQYRMAYREGFKQGYEAAYRGGAYR